MSESIVERVAGPVPAGEFGFTYRELDAVQVYRNYLLNGQIVGLRAPWIDDTLPPDVEGENGPQT